MSPDQSARSPVVRFLGEDAGKGGPFAMLGLPHAIESDNSVRKAQQRRLRQVDHHPHRTTPDAHEVRLAIYSAATQLLDPALREQLARRWPEGNPIDVPQAWRPKRAMKQLTPAFVQSARRVLGSSGGWNPVARRRLAHLARINRVSAMEIIQALGSAPAAGSQSKAPTRSTPLKLPPPPTGSASWFIAYATVGVLACVLLITIVIDPRTQSTSTSSPSSLPQAPLQDSYTTMGAQSESEQHERERLSHYTALAHELNRLVARATIDPEGTIERFGVIYPLFVDSWTQFPIEALERAAINISEMTARLEQQAISPQRLTTMLAVSGLDPKRLMIVSGVIELVLSSPQLGTQTKDQLAALRERYSDAEIMQRTQLAQAITEIAYEQATAQQDDDPSWWAAWSQGAKHASTRSSREHTKLMLEALGSRLLDSDPPGSDWLKTASMLSRELGWRDNSSERYWLLTQFADDQVSTARLSMLTEAIATTSAAEGIDISMVLPRDANTPQRAQLAQAYRDAWFPPAQSTASDRSGSAASSLLQQLELEIISAPKTMSRTEAADRIVTLTALSVAAQLSHQDEEAASQELLLNPPQIQIQDTRSQRTPLQISAGDPTWAERVVNCESSVELRPLLNEIDAQQSIGLNGAHALVFLADQRVQSDMRGMALEQLVRLRTRPEVLLAIDHALSDNRVSARLDEVVRAVLAVQLPDRNDPNWYTQAREAVLAQIAQSVGENQESSVSALPFVLHDVWSILLTDQEHDRFQREASPVQVLGQLNVNTHLQIVSLMHDIGSTSQRLASVESRARVQHARAPTTLHAYLVELRYALALRTLIIEETIPGAARLIADIESELSQRDTASTGVLEQIVHTQRALAQLWVITLERGGGP